MVFDPRKRQQRDHGRGMQRGSQAAKIAQLVAVQAVAVEDRGQCALDPGGVRRAMPDRGESPAPTRRRQPFRRFACSRGSPPNPAAAAHARSRRSAIALLRWPSEAGSTHSTRLGRAGRVSGCIGLPTGAHTPEPPPAKASQSASPPHTSFPSSPQSEPRGPDAAGNLWLGAKIGRERPGPR